MTPVYRYLLFSLLCSGCLQAEQTNPLESSSARILGVERVSVIRPNGAEFWYVGATHEIVWVRNAIDTTVSLHLSTDNGQSYTHEIVRDIPNTGSMAWEVPDMPSKHCRIRITGADPVDPLLDESDIPFTILRKPVPRQRTVDGGEWPSWRSDRLAFMSQRTGNYDVWVLNVSSVRLNQITDDPAFDGHPSFDKKGFHLAFTSSRTGQNEIWATSFFLDNDPTPIQITTTGGEQPNWRPFPSASRFTYLAPQAGGLFKVARGEIDLPLDPPARLLELRSLTNISGHQKPFWSIRTSDDADLIYYQTTDPRFNPSDIVTIRADRGFALPEAFRLPFSSPVKNPAMSPSNSRLAVSVNGDIWMVTIVDDRVVGTPLQLTFSPDEEDHPNWKSDSELAFQSDRTGRWEIWTLEIE